MGKVDVYIGGYLVIDDVTKGQSELLASNACMVGNPVTIVYNAETSEFTATLPNGEAIGTVHPKNRLAMREAFEDGWTCAAWLSLVWWDQAQKLFKGELVYQFFHVKASQAAEQANLEAYTRKTAERLAAGKRPDVHLTGAGWDQVVETGDWAGEKEQPLPIDTRRNSGTVVFKRKRSVSDKFAAAALGGGKGFRVASGAVLVAVVVLVALALWNCMGPTA